MTELPVTKDQSNYANGDQDSWTYVIVEASDHRHRQQHCDRAGHQHHSGLVRGVVEQGLGKLRQQETRSKKREADYHPEARAHAERHVAKQAEIYHRFVACGVPTRPAPPARRRRQPCRSRSRWLENQSTSSPRSSTTCASVSPTVSRTMPVQSMRATPRFRYDGSCTNVLTIIRPDDAERHVDVEDPLPAVLVDQPSADDRSDRRREHDAHAVNRHRHALLGGRKGLARDCLRAGHQAAAADPLHHAVKNHLMSGSSRCPPVSSRR